MLAISAFCFWFQKAPRRPTGPDLEWKTRGFATLGGNVKLKDPMRRSEERGCEAAKIRPADKGQSQMSVLGVIREEEVKVRASRILEPVREGVNILS